jgi:hypothetical protein
MAPEPSRANLIWQSGFRPGARLRWHLARMVPPVLTVFGLRGQDLSPRHRGP